MPAKTRPARWRRAKVEALRPYCLSVKEPAEVEADVKQAADAADASTDNENAVNLDDITVDVTISPAEAEIGETVTLSANITSPNGLDGVKMQWQYCVLKIVDGIASADWHDAENATEATYTFVMTEETRPYTWRLHLSLEEPAVEPAVEPAE